MLVLSTVIANAELVDMTVKLANLVIEQGTTQKTYLKVGLTARGEVESTTPRTRANAAIVIDRSGLMQGDKLPKHARPRS
ncbi:MAG TPA: hypothetical protein DCR55_00540 [Lentisphaeria bacterium]|jgi:hypothetical protein|nr:hypothetical protein [Lentisphaeria bacterium]